ncbi:MAG: hypothetical protein WD738_08750 [Pirellulales bacterium]
MAKRIPTDPKYFLKLATRHLKRVQAAKDEPDWSDLGTYGLYCLEALIRAAALKSRETPIRTHWGKADQAKNLAKKHGLPDISNLLSTLNVARKANAYGDEEFDESDHDADDIATEIEKYYDKIKAFVSA